MYGIRSAATVEVAQSAAAAAAAAATTAAAAATCGDEHAERTLLLLLLLLQPPPPHASRGAHQPGRSTQAKKLSEVFRRGASPPPSILLLRLRPQAVG
jgi:hypothetical protein